MERDAIIDHGAIRASGDSWYLVSGVSDSCGIS